MDVRANSIHQIVSIFHFVKETGIIPTFLMDRPGQVGQLAKSVSRKNRRIVMLILMTNLIYKVAMSLYKFQALQTMNGRFRHLPRELWRNDFPIVLVHGFAGSAPDQSKLLGNYFLYALKQSVQPYWDVYVAVVNPFGGFHDRACELYQQLVGINALKKKAGISANDNGPNLVRAVYGHQHYCEEHLQQKVYKPRLLRQIKDDQIIGYSDGIPGGWSSKRKIHFIGHSMGAQTVRYLQDLMSYDYFE